ncbi:hypothetical protein FACS189449_11190 [Alphaproteobacteria bacterium]|nr:hypothetical protein FACS189449_11190 [Alphaproteobacteria bacterium]
MHSLKKVKFLLLLLCFYTCNAGLNFGHFTNANDVFDMWLGADVDIYEASAPGDPKKLKIPLHCCPFWGLTMLGTKYLENLKFKGNVVAIKNPTNGLTQYKPQKDDALEGFIFRLFPSNAPGVLPPASIWDTSAKAICFNSDHNPEMLALLLLKAEIFRVLVNNGVTSLPTSMNSFDDFSTEARRIPNYTDVTKFYEAITKLTTGQRVFDVIVKDVSDTQIFNAILDEKSYGYAEHTVEHVILAFVCQILNGKAEAQMFLQKYSEYRNKVFSKEYITRSSKIPAESTANNISNMTKEIKELLSQPGLPYDNPTSNGWTPKYRIDSGKFVKDTDLAGKDQWFNDCMETSIRHIFNYVLGENGRNTIRNDESFLSKGFLPTDEEPTNAETGYKKSSTNRLAQLKAFYKEIEINNTGLNSNVYDDRGVWNQVMCCLNSSSANNGVVYLSEGENAYRQNELNPGFVNVLRVMCVVIGIEPNSFLKGIVQEDLKDPAKLGGQTEIIAEKFNKLFKIISPTQDYQINFDEYNVRKNDVSGRMRVIITNEEKKEYGFMICQSEGSHAWVEGLPNKDELKHMWELNKLNSEEKHLVGYLFSRYGVNDTHPQGVQNDYHSIFSYADRRTDYASLEKSIIAFQKSADPQCGKKPAALRQILGNITKDIPFSDNYTARSACRLILSTVNDDDNSYKEIVKIVKASPDGKALDEFIAAPKGLQRRLPDSLADVRWIDEDIELNQWNMYLLKFPNLEYVNFSNLNCDLDSSQLPSSIKELVVRDASDVNLNLSGCRNLEALELDRGKYQSLQLPTSLKKFKTGYYAEINDHMNLLTYENLIDVDLSGHIKSVQLPTSLEKLNTWCLKVEQPLDIASCKNLKMLHTNDYYNESFYESLEFLEDLAIQKVASQNLNLSNCKKLKKLVISCDLTNIQLPDSLEEFRIGHKVKIGNFSAALLSCKNLTKMAFWAAARVPDVQSIQWPASLEELEITHTKIDGSLILSPCKNLKNVKFDHATLADVSLPSSLDEFSDTSSGTIVERLDMSSCKKIKKQELYGSYKNAKLPNSLVEFKLAWGTIEEPLDLSDCKNLQKVHLVGKIPNVKLPDDHVVEFIDSRY